MTKCLQDRTSPALLREAVERLEGHAKDFDRAVTEALDVLTAAGRGLRETEERLTTEHARQEADFRKLIEQHKEAQQQSAERAKLEKKRNAVLKALARTASSSRRRSPQCSTSGRPCSAASPNSVTSDSA